MKVINVYTAKSSELNPEISEIESIAIEDDPFDSGAFGEVYNCLSINNNTPAIKQAIKVFIDDGSGSAEKGYKTILKLQDEIIAYNKRLIINDQPTIDRVGALYAIPQFSFEGDLGAKKVLGYSANLLSDLEWFQFGKIFDGDKHARLKMRKSFYGIPAIERLELAYELAEGFHHLEKMNFIYADLNPQNIFIRRTGRKLALIDYESGGIDEDPETMGKPGDWMAPEILEQMHSGSGEIKVDKACDAWAVGIGIHYMLFDHHPLFYLKIIGKTELTDYFSAFRWPEVNPSHYNFQKLNEKKYTSYVRSLKANIHPALRSLLSRNINSGYRNPTQRVAYHEWMDVIGCLLEGPEISVFEIQNPVVIKGFSTTLKWKVENAVKVVIDNGIGIVQPEGEIKIKPQRDTTYKLVATGHFKSTFANIELVIFPLPALETLQIPAPDLNTTIQLRPIVPEFNFDLSVNIDKYLFAGEPANFITPDGDYENAVPEHYYIKGRPGISEIFDKIKKTIRL